MKQIASDFKDELEQNLNSAAETVRAEPKKFFQSVKSSVTGKAPKQGDFGKALEKMTASAQSGQIFDPLVSDKPAPSKKMMAKITDMTAAIAARKQDELRKRLEEIRNEAITKGSDQEQAVTGGDGTGPEVKHGSKKLTPIQQSVRNAENATESKDTGGMG